MAIEIKDVVHAQCTVIGDAVSPAFRGAPLGFNTITRQDAGDYDLTLDEPLPQNQQVLLVTVEGSTFARVGADRSGNSVIRVQMEAVGGAGLDLTFNLVVLSIPRREVA